ncbi:hypothetical protein ACF0H5_003418 [Mactra antiquata]
MEDQAIISEANDFVESVMGSQRMTKVITPIRTVNWKRHASDPCETPDKEQSVKKPRTVVNVKRTLYNTGCDTDKSIDKPIDSNASSANSLKHLIHNLSADLHMMFSALNERVKQLESGLEQRISNKVAQLLDKRVNSEMARIRKDVNTQLDSFKDNLKDELANELEDINSKINKYPLKPHLVNNLQIFHSTLLYEVYLRPIMRLLATQ